MFMRTSALDFGGSRGRQQGGTRRQEGRHGRFLQPDPLGHGDGMNPYAYVGGDPVNWIDPDGLAKQDIVITWRPKPQNPHEGARSGTFGPVSPGGGGNPERGEDNSAAECLADPEHCAVVTGRKKPSPFTRIVRRIGHILDRGAERHLRPPEGRRSDESQTECVFRIAGDTPALGVVGAFSIAAGGAWLGYPRRGFSGGGGGTSLISSAARGAFGKGFMGQGFLGTGNLGGAIGRVVSKGSVLTGAAAVGWAAGTSAGAVQKCR